MDVVEYGWRRIVLVTAIMLAAVLETLDSTIVNVALPTIEGNIGAGIDEGVWIVTGYIISNVVSIPLNPILIRIFGRRAYFTVCIAGFTIASILCGTSHSLGELVTFRILQGAFGGGLIATSQGVMRDTFPPQQLGISSALFAIALLLGPAFGPLAGGWLTDNFTWNWIFDVNIVPGTIAAIVVFTMLRDPEPARREPIDWFGIALLAAGLGTLQFVLDNGERRDWINDPGIAIALTLSVVSLAAFVWWQWSGTKRPVVDLHVLRFRSVGVGSLIALAFGAVIFAPAIIMPLYSSSILGYTAWDSGVLLVMRALPVVLLTPVFATIAQNGADVRYMLGGGFLMSGISLWWLSGEMTSSAPFTALAIPLLVSGIAQSMLLVPLIVGVLSTTPAELNAKVSPLITLSVQLGGSTASAACVAFFDRRTSFHGEILSAAANGAHLASLGLQPTHDALLSLASAVSQQASTLGFADTIMATAAIAALVTPIVLLFPRSKAIDGGAIAE
jgi:MFS transporter, DHA2 family, multidrug resistance protein